MEIGIRGRHRSPSQQHRPSPSSHPEISAKEKEIHQRKKSKIELENKDWEDATCSVCMEYPHNAVLLLCSSHDKGCRPYVCSTSHRYSNCLEQFKKAYLPKDIRDVTELQCPLCRGKVKGMTVVEPVREYLNGKRRSCTQDDCSFMGTYKELRKHVRKVHPYKRRQAVDPILEQKWRRLEREREHDDVMSAIRSSMPGAVVLGDYVIERNHYSSYTEDDTDGEATDDSEVGINDHNFLDLFSVFQEIRRAENANLNTRLRRLQRGYRRRTTFDGVVRGSLGIPATVAVGNGATTLAASSQEGNDESFFGRLRRRHRERSERRRRHRSQQLRTVTEEEEWRYSY